MSDDQLPVRRPDQRLVLKKDAEVEEELVKGDERKAAQSFQSSLTGQIIKTVVSSALDWFSNRHASRQDLLDRVDGENYPSTRFSKSERLSSEKEARLESEARRGVKSRQARKRRMGWKGNK